MDIRHGIDLVECARIAEVTQRHGRRFLNRVLTDAEQACAKRFKDATPFISGRWAGKEAVLKMLGTGWRGNIAWRDIEVLPDEKGQPIVTLHDECARIAAELGIKTIRLSISHTDRQAMASAIGWVD
jgi:holo-[acyl-carrier protein] synthase